MDLSLTSSDVRDGSTLQSAICAAAISAGDVVYKDGSSQLAKADATSVDKAAIVGVAVNDAAAGQRAQFQATGDLTVGSVLTAGSVYVLSATVGGGKIAPIADLVSTNFVTILGVAKSSTVLDLSIAKNTGTQVP